MLGISLVSNFRLPNYQEHTKVPGIIHYIGRTLVGVCGIKYCSLQTIITYYLIKPQTNTVKLFALRLATSILLCMSGLMHVSMDVWLAARLLKGAANSEKQRYSNLKDEEDTMFFINDISEWLTFVLFALFSSTYSVEFHRLDRLEMSCFEKDSQEKKPAERFQNGYFKLKQEGSENSDLD
ncbi:hypothetical protein AWC38_SpisGene8259 [Stylophora pistillata]|uniref:CWH43-like N-terminal domain-containing protein n=1 Tax=Stylophora pistillata TaxID=50429 RepID=A0A2B4SEK7_STYPI|nr:hypothetical protein AWC38_SpisGene8259 [Stylophora pistillata]